MKRRSFLGGAGASALASQLPIPATAAATTARGPQATAATREFPQRRPMQPDLSRSLNRRYLGKPVHASRTIDDMSATLGWTMKGPGSVSYADGPVRTGTRAMTLTFPKRDDATLAHLRQRNGSFDAASGGVSTLGLDFAPAQDWSGYTRLSLWVYAHPGRSRNRAFAARFLCDGASETGPTDLAAWHFFHDIPDDAWTQLVWEFPDFKRDRVTRLELMNMISGVQLGEQRDNVYSIDAIAVQHVDPEPFEGWQPAPGRIVFQHIGYEPADRKVAIAGPLPQTDFQAVDDASGRVVGSWPVVRIANPRGSFSELDFTPLVRPGRYRLRCGPIETAAFPIAADVWRGPVEKCLNFFYAQRCGYDVPGVHDVCHQDLQGRHGEVTKVINGGWHDAGDTCQGSYRTNLAFHAMIELAEQIALRRSDARLHARVLEEAKWGIDWALRTRFGDGYRILFATNRFFTDNIVGGANALDDTVVEAGEAPDESFIFAMAAANAARVLAADDPARAAALRAAAIEDYRSAVRQVLARDVIARDEAAFGALAAVALLRLTAEATYASEAARLGKALSGCQERRTGPDGRLTGWYYTDTARLARIHDAHGSFAEAPAMAFWKLCTYLPDHPDWADWYAGSVIESEQFFAHGSTHAAPYRYLPNSVWREDELARPARAANGMPGMPPTPPGARALIARQTRAQFDAGVPLGGGQRLRFFPIWPPGVVTGVLPPLHFQGATAIHLAGTASLLMAAQLRGAATPDRLARMQLQWVFGGNPFGQTLMYGEGHDYPDLWAAITRNMVGALPVGINSRSDDAPYWPCVNHFTFKEQWVVPAAKFMLATAFVGQPALVRGRAPAAARFVARSGGAVSRVGRGAYRIVLPAGDYDVFFGDASVDLTLVAGRDMHLDLDPASYVTMASTGEDGAVVLTVAGRGRHVVTFRTWNASIDQARIVVELTGDRQELPIRVAAEDAAMPWVAMAIANGDVRRAVELMPREERG